MPKPPHRTPEMKAKYASRFARTPAELEQLLQRVSSVHRAGILERLRPHLTFEPTPSKTAGDEQQ